ncbi:MAG: glutathione S-transferase family protein [Pseudomonadota bacterium]
MKLFGHPDSGHAYKVKLMLAVAGIPHDYTVIDIFSPRDSRPAQFRQFARFCEVPLLVNDGAAYTQSNAILLHLAERTGQWGGQDAARLRACREWLMWEANKIGMCLPQLRGHQRFADMRLDPGARAWLLSRYEHDVGLLDQHLAHQPGFVVGDTPTIADFSLSAYLHYADEAQVAVPAHVAGWLTRISQLNGWQPPYRLLA